MEIAARHTRYFSSRLFVTGSVLLVGAIVVLPLFVTELAEETCTTPGPANPSWDCTHLMAVDFRIPVLMGASGMALMLVTALRMRRAKRRSDTD